MTSGMVGISFKADGWYNKGGTAGRPNCDCGPYWKDHWETQSGEEWPEECSVEGCTRDAEHGAHLVSEHESGEWIAPFCPHHNGKGTNKEFTLKDLTTLISANTQDCGCYKG